MKVNMIKKKNIILNPSFHVATGTQNDGFYSYMKSKHWQIRTERHTKRKQRLSNKGWDTAHAEITG